MKKAEIKEIGVSSKTLRKYYHYKVRCRTVDGVKQKRCRKCEIWKEESKFYKKVADKGGLATYCKECSDKDTNRCRRQRLPKGITNKSITWSSQDERLLKKLWSKESDSDIAKKIGRSVSAIINRAYKLGLSRRNK